MRRSCKTPREADRSQATARGRYKADGQVRGGPPWYRRKLDDSNHNFVYGKQDFYQQKLNMLQIGLGTFGTFVQNFTCPEEVNFAVSWLLDATSDNSDGLLAVGVEPVPEHVDRLVPMLKHLRNSALVQAAVTGQDQEQIEVHAITPDSYEKHAQAMRPAELRDFNYLVVFLRNMSCVGQAHPEFSRLNAFLAATCGVNIEMQPIRARAISYGALVQKLGFRGVEVLLIDAEGYDCKILQSMIDHCSLPGNQHAWPELIQFETMGHSNWMGNGSAKDLENEMCSTLEQVGYMVVCYGKDTQLIRLSAVETEPRLQRWVDTFCCRQCKEYSHDGMPFWHTIAEGNLCKHCSRLFQAFGSCVWEWATTPDDPRLSTLTTNGLLLWGVDCHGRACCCRQGRWEYSGNNLLRISVSSDESLILGLDTSGRVMQCSNWNSSRWDELPGSPRLGCISVAGDSWRVWGVDFNGQVWVYLRESTSWEEMSGWLDQVSIAWNGRDVWGVNSYDEVYYCSGIYGLWNPAAGKLKKVSVSADGRHLWGLNDWSQVFWTYTYKMSWIRVPGYLVDICASEDGMKVWGLDKTGYVWGFSCT